MDRTVFGYCIGCGFKTDDRNELDQWWAFGCHNMFDQRCERLGAVFIMNDGAVRFHATGQWWEVVAPRSSGEVRTNDDIGDDEIERLVYNERGTEASWRIVTEQEMRLVRGRINAMARHHRVTDENGAVLSGVRIVRTSYSDGILRAKVVR